MRPRHEPHEWAQTGGGQCAGEEEAGHIGLEVVIEHRGTGKQLEIAERSEGAR